MAEIRTRRGFSCDFEVVLKISKRQEHAKRCMYDICNMLLTARQPFNETYSIFPGRSQQILTFNIKIEIVFLFPVKTPHTPSH